MEAKQPQSEKRTEKSAETWDELEGDVDAMGGTLDHPEPPKQPKK